jgi:hypothetical protein
MHIQNVTGAALFLSYLQVEHSLHLGLGLSSCCHISNVERAAPATLFFCLLNVY